MPKVPGGSSGELTQCVLKQTERRGEVLEMSGTEGPHVDTANSGTKWGAGPDSSALCPKGRLAEERAGESQSPRYLLAYSKRRATHRTARINTASSNTPAGVWGYTLFTLRKKHDCWTPELSLLASKWCSQDLVLTARLHYNTVQMRAQHPRKTLGEPDVVAYTQHWGGRGR